MFWATLDLAPRLENAPRERATFTAACRRHGRVLLPAESSAPYPPRRGTEPELITGREATSCVSSPALQPFSDGAAGSTL